MSFKTRAVFALLGFAVSAASAWAHCDTLEGPVVSDARRALESGRPDAVLKWVPAADEPGIREAFAETLALRAISPEAAAFADRWFFETVVRIHRAGEGAPYSGLKTHHAPEPGIAAADQALADGSGATLAKAMGDAIAAQLHRRFERVRELKKHSDESVEAGRAYVAAYVDFVHFAERVAELAAGPSVHGHASDGGHAHRH